MNHELNIRDLHKHHEDRRKTREKYYNNVLQKCWNRITMISSMHSYTTSCLFQIPEFVFGVPPYDMNECKQYIFNSLTKNGFRVELRDNKTFFISWDKKDIPKNVFEIPIQNVEKPKEIIKPKSKKKYKGIDEYAPTGRFLYDSLWNKVDQNNKNLFNDL